MPSHLYKKIVIAGGSGSIGNFLQHYFQDNSSEVIVLSRQTPKQLGNIRYILWDGKTLGPWAVSLEEADMLINLTGKSVNCRYTKKNKQEIFDSRTDATVILGEAIKQLISPPAVWFNAASATIYRHAEDRPHDEFNGEYENDFSVQVCKRWEATFQKIQLPQTRKVILRMAIVLGKKEGVMSRFESLTKFGLGGKQGNGKQYFSWIHEEDLARALEFIYHHPEIDGVVNFAAPTPLKNKEFMATIRSIIHPLVALPSPEWLLKLGALVIGTETELLLKSRWVLPRRLLEAGFEFRYPTVAIALKNLLTK